MVSTIRPVKTRLTKLLNIKTPIASAPMGYGWSADLAYAVASAGGFGMIGAAFDSPEQLRTSIRGLRKRLGVPDGERVPIGVGLIGWVLDRTEATEDPRIPAVLDELPTAIMFAFGNDLGAHIRAVRKHEADRAHKTLVFVCVNSVQEAVRAVNEWKVDVLVAQGIESGGHGGNYAPTLSILITAILAALPNAPPIFGAGGIATGAQVASLLALGASGALLGTRLLFTPECGYSPAQKSLILNATLNSTKRGMCFDEVNRTLGWPENVDGRAIANGIWVDAEDGLPLEERQRRFDDAKAGGVEERTLAWAGAGAALTKEVKGAANVIVEVHEELVQRLQAVSAIL